MRVQHLPLSEQTRGLIGERELGLMKRDAIVINVARGAVTDETALAEAVKENKIGAIGIDVYSVEPFGKDHPFYAIKDLPNVCLTPHMAWGGYETRVRLLNEIEQNIDSFLAGGTRNRIER